MNAFTLLCKRWFLNRQRWGRTVIVIIVSLFLTSYYVLAQSFALSAEQNAESALGNADYGVYLTSPEPGDRIDSKTLFRAVQAGGGTPDSVQIRAFIGVDGVSLTAIRGDPNTVTYREWVRGDIPAERYTLIQGKMPKYPGQIAVSQSLYERLPNKTKVTLYPSGSTHKVVGVISYKFDTDSLFLLGAPGTFSIMPRNESSTYRFDSWETITWTGGELPRVLENLAIFTEHQDVEQFTLGMDVREDITHSKSLIDRTPALFLLPATLLGIMCSFMVVSLNMPGLRAQNMGFARLGIPKRELAASAALVLTTQTLIAAITGVCIGLLVSMAGRWFIIPKLLTHPIATWPNLWPLWPVVLIPAVSSAVLTLGAFFLTKTANRVKQSDINVKKRWKPGIFDAVRWQLSFLCIFVTMMLSHFQSDINDVAYGGLYLIAALLLLFPDMVRVILRFPEISIGSGISRRLMLVHHKQVAIMAGVMSLTLALPLSLSVLYSSYYHSLEELELIPSGNLLMEINSEEEDKWLNIAHEMEQKANLSEPVKLNHLSEAFIFNSYQELRSSLIYSVESIEEIENVFQCDFSAADKEKILDGAMVLMGQPRTNIPNIEVERNNSFWRKVPVVSCGKFTSWFTHVSVVVLNDSPVAQIGQPYLGNLVYTNVSDEQIKKAQDTLNQIHINTAYLGYHYELPPPTVPWHILVPVIVLAFCGLIVGFVISKALGQTLRSSVLKCRSLGFPRKIYHGMVFHHLVRLMITVIPVTMAVALLPAVIVATVNKYFLFYMPVMHIAWGIIVLLLLGLFGVTGIFWGLSSSQRQADKLL